MPDPHRQQKGLLGSFRLDPVIRPDPFFIMRAGK